MEANRLTSRDMEIINFIEQYGTLNAKQAAKIFFKYKEDGTPINQSRLVANKRLKAISDTVIGVSSILDSERNHNYFFKIINNKAPSIHAIKLIDLYAELIDKGVKIITFDTKGVYDNAYPDCFIEYEYNGIQQKMFVEIDINNSVSAGKYIPLYEKNIYKPFPYIVIISSKIEKKNKDSELPYKVFRLNYSMDISELLK